MSAQRVVIVGSGFGGLQATRGLRGAPVEITLIDRRNFHLFQPLRYQVATGALSPREVAYPLRAVFERNRNVRVLLAEVDRFTRARQVVRNHPPPIKKCLICRRFRRSTGWCSESASRSWSVSAQLQPCTTGLMGELPWLLV